ncbi:hypothetical protein [Kribbella sp. HUAS MG21]|uniref:Serine/threonine protein kinase n=1 Tax=Kribbella sp. HUAS MG21 TaxID=3160966 RepID=A0AAU7THW2_9ACTN
MSPSARPGIGRLVAVVAATAAVAVAAGGAVAFRQGPSSESSSHVVPLGGPPPSTTQSETPVAATTPSIKPKPAPTLKPTLKPTPKATPSSPTPPKKTLPSKTPTPTGPIALEAAKLPQGQDPQLTYRFWHTVRGPGKQLTIPGTGSLDAFARLGNGVFAIASGGELTELDGTGAVLRRVPHVTTLAGRPDGSAVAYAVTAPVETGEYGATLYSDTGAAEESVKLPDVRSLQILAYAKDKVYYQASTQDTEPKLYSWTPGAAKPVRLPVAGQLLDVSRDGRLASWLPAANVADGCSTVTEIATGKKRFESCDFTISGFTPDGAVAIGRPRYGDGCSNVVTALDARTGKVLRQWSGCFYRATAEDNRHLLMVAVISGGGQAPVTKSTVVRCAIDTGECERATEITTAKDVGFTS